MFLTPDASRGTMGSLAAQLEFCSNWITCVPDGTAVNLMYRIQSWSEPSHVHKIFHPTWRPATVALKVV